MDPKKSKKKYKKGMIMAKRVLSLLLCGVMLLSVLALVACTEKTPTPGTSGSAGTSSGSGTEITTPASTEKECPIPAEDMDGYEFVAYEGYFGTGNTVASDFTVDESTSSVLDEAKFRRNALVENRFGVTVTAEQVKCTSTTGSAEGYGVVMKYKTSGDPSYDTVILPAYDQTKLAINGALFDMPKIPYLDLTQSYWDQQVVDNLSIKGMLFFLEGDYSISAFDAAVVIAFNKELAKQNQINDLYDLVSDGKWTMAKWMEYTRLVTGDLNGDDMYTQKDLYGSLLWDDAIYAVVHSTGELCCTLDDNGDLVLTAGTEKIVTAFSDFVTFAKENCCFRYQRTFNDSGVATDYSASTYGKEMFTNNQGLFFFAALSAVNEIRDMETDYGILPPFKYSEEQDRYYATVNPYGARFMGMPLFLEDEERSGKLLEAIGFYSEDIIPYAYYEKTLVGSVIKDEESLPMLELIRNSRVYDLGYFYQPSNINKNYIYLFRAYNPAWATQYAKLEKAASTVLDKQINKSFDTLAETWAQH